MNSNNDEPLDEAGGQAATPAPGIGVSSEASQAFDAMPVEDLAAAWCALQYVGLPYSDPEACEAAKYFDRFPHEQPERAFQMVLAVLRSEADKSVKMQLNGKLMMTLMHKHSTMLVPSIEKAAHEMPQMRWLLGGAAWFAGDKSIKPRLQALADEAGWDADDEARSTPKKVIDFSSLTATGLAKVWVEQKSKPAKDQDDNWQALVDREQELLKENPDAILDMIVEILKLEADRKVLGLLAAGPLEDVISFRTIDRIEREAAINEKFAWLLGGVRYDREPEEIQKRLDAIIQGRSWAN